MNYLAHLLLAPNHPESRLGNFLGDFVKGQINPDNHEYSPEICHGILAHRQIDSFTDGHPIYLQSKRRLGTEKSRFAGIMVDIYYDHFLAKNWHHFSKDNLEDFVRSCYQLLRDYSEQLPPRLQGILPQIIQENWLCSYRSLEGIGLTFRRLSRRFKRDNPLEDAIADLKLHYSDLEADFFYFFPELMTYARQLHEHHLQ